MTVLYESHPDMPDSTVHAVYSNNLCIDWSISYVLITIVETFIKIDLSSVVITCLLVNVFIYV